MATSCKKDLLNITPTTGVSGQTLFSDPNLQKLLSITITGIWPMGFITVIGRHFYWPAQPMKRFRPMNPIPA